MLRRSPVFFICFTFLIGTLSAAHHQKWPTREQELIDEARDLDIIKSVQQSMAEWEHHRKKNEHRRKRADKSVCYGELGCFEDSGPFGYLEMLPSSPEEIGTTFYFYSTKNRSDRPLVELPYINMTEAWQVFAKNYTETNTTSIPKKWASLKNFVKLNDLSVRIIVHGFGSSCSHVWIYEMRTALMAVEDCIVICVDWENGANLPNYVRAAANTRLIGKQLSMLIKGLQEYKGLNLTKVHIIGFSLGAHVSGFAGTELPGLSRITGLDPAGPLFESQHPKARLDSSDARFVDVIHSNGENLILGGLGSWQPMGHVDFYPNGGRVQHGCSNLFVGAFTDFIWSPAAAVEGRSLCNHRRAYKFFIDSVAPRCLFPAFPCDSYDDFLKGQCFPCGKEIESTSSGAKCGNMGYYADRSTGRGQLYLLTREEEPFCAHQFNVEIYSSESDAPLRTLGKIEVILEGDGALNETFSITEKDDSEIFAGDVMSRILVPHPALGFPQSVTLTYKPYSGWISRGLQLWTIHKVVLTDSFGESMSYCQKDISLDSENPVYLKLQKGDCYIAEENDVTVGPQPDKQHYYETSTLDDINRSDEIKHSTSNPGSSVDEERLREKKEVIDLGTNFKVAHNLTHSYSEQTNKIAWNPVLDGGNSLDGRDSTESSRNFPDPGKSEIFEPILKTKTIREEVHIGRSITEKSDTSTEKKEEIREPILKATTQKSRKMKNVVLDSEVSKPRENSLFTIQLLPFRLGELIERAERYARETLLPLISEQAPRFFGFGRSDSRSERMPKYFPPLGDLAEEEAQETSISERRIDLPPNINGTLIEVPEYEEELERSTAAIVMENDPTLTENGSQTIGLSESRSQKNIFSLLRRRNQGKSMMSQNQAENRNYYIRAEESSTDDGKIRIDLPTYKPPQRSLPSAVFPYKFEPIVTDQIKVIPLIRQSDTSTAK